MFDFSLEHLFSYVVTLERPQMIGAIPEGIRAIFYAAEGEVTGPKLRGRFLPGGGDWLTVRTDGVGILDVRGTLESDDGALIYMAYTGVGDLGEDGYQKFLRGELPASVKLRVAPRFHTSHREYLWLNRLQCLNIGEVDLQRRLCSAVRSGCGWSGPVRSQRHGRAEMVVAHQTAREDMAMLSVKGLAPLYRDSHGLPWIPFTPYSASVKLKLLKIDPVTGQVITLLHVPDGEGLGVHNHHGTVIVYTVQGAWRYLEHEWTAKAGDFVYETAGSQHTFVAEPGEDVVAFIVIEGALEFLDPQGHSMGLENWKTLLERYYRFCEENHLRPIDLSQFE